MLWLVLFYFFYVSYWEALVFYFFSFLAIQHGVGVSSEYSNVISHYLHLHDLFNSLASTTSINTNTKKQR